MNEVGQLRHVLLRSPSEAFVDQSTASAHWHSLGYLGEPDYDNAVREHAALTSLLEGCGARVDKLPGAAALTMDAIYTRDAAVTVPPRVQVRGRCGPR